MFFQKPTYQPTVCLLVTTFFSSLSSFLFSGGEKSKVSSSFNTTTLFPPFFALASPAIKLPFFDPIRETEVVCEKSLSFIFWKVRLLSAVNLQLLKRSRLFCKMFIRENRGFFFGKLKVPKTKKYISSLFCLEICCFWQTSHLPPFREKKCASGQYFSASIYGKRKWEALLYFPLSSPSPSLLKIKFGQRLKMTGKEGWGWGGYFFTPTSQKSITELSAEWCWHPKNPRIQHCGKIYSFRRNCGEQRLNRKHTNIFCPKISFPPWN